MIHDFNLFNHVGKNWPSWNILHFEFFSGHSITHSLFYGPPEGGLVVL
jgi:hypothetical protein